MSLRRILTLVLLAGSGSLLSAISPAPSRATTLTDSLSYQCSETQPLQVDCSYRWLGPTKEQTTVSAQLGDAPVEAANTPYPASDDVTAILFMVDTSDPRREPAIDAIKPQLRAMLAAASPRQRFGLAAFDTNLRILAPLGALPSEIEKAIADLKATGKTTELYRNALEGLKLLQGYKAGRRALYLFSDGLAEDFSYHHEDVIKKALELDIPIVGVGYPRSVALSVGLQSLRKLAEDSGGYYIGASADTFKLPEDFIANPYWIAETGGRIHVDLTSLAATKNGAQTLTLQLRAGDAQASITYGVAFPTPQVAPTAPGTTPVSSSATMPVASPSTPAVAPTPTAPEPGHRWDVWLWYGVPVLCLLAVLIALGLYGRYVRRAATTAPIIAMPPTPAGKPYAYLVQHGATETRHAIDQSPWRIGRSRNNELTIDDVSISRQHAEIHRRYNGKFDITDLESMNGIYVNDKKVKQAELNEGDTVEIGDISFRFTRFDDDPASMQQTVMVRTRIP